MSVDRMEHLLSEMTEEERVALWTRMKRRGIDVAYEADSASLNEHSVLKFAKRRGGSDRLRALACKDSQSAYFYARDIDKGPHKETRAAASRSSLLAAAYGEHIDKRPHEVTRIGACASVEGAYRYALMVDKGPHEMTRKAVCSDPEHAYAYALNIEGGYHQDTWRAVCGTGAEGLYTDMLSRNNGW